MFSSPTVNISRFKLFRRISYFLRHPQTPTGGFGPFGPEVSRPGGSERVSPKIRVSEELSEGVSRGPLWPRPQECPKGVPRVSPECQKGVRTLRRHSRDTFWTLLGPGPQGPPRHSARHSLGHPDFWGHSLGHSGGHFGPEGPEAYCRGLGMSQSYSRNFSTSTGSHFWEFSGIF